MPPLNGGNGEPPVKYPSIRESDGKTQSLARIYKRQKAATGKRGQGRENLLRKEPPEGTQCYSVLWGGFKF